MEADTKLIGKHVRLIDGVELVTGNAIFGTDIYRPGMLFAKALRSPYAHARIKRISTEKAKKLPGVKAIVTAEDTPNRLYGFWLRDLPVFAREKVRYIGEPVAAVAAETEDIAEEAIKLIEVEYEVLPAAVDITESIKPDAPIIHENLENYEARYDLVRYGNICSHSTIIKGDVEQGFKESDYVFEHTFRTQTQHQAYIEPHAATVEVDKMGRVTIWTTTQRVFLTREQVSEALGIPMSKIRVIGTKIGGGFGGKETLLEPILVLLAMKSGKSVKWVFTREEEFFAGRPRHASLVRLKTGVKKDGTLVARKVELYYDTGAYADSGIGVTAIGALFALGPYKVQHARIDAHCVYTNKVVAGAFRAYGNPQGSFAAEVQMDMIARELGIDPYEIRKKNLLVDGDELVTGQIVKSVGALETLEAAVKRADWFNRTAGPNEGWGMAVMIRPCGMFPASAVLKMNEDGTFHLLTGSMDLGTGSRTTLAMVAAEELKVPLSDITVVSADTDATPYDYGTIASRIAYAVGPAVREAALTLRTQILEHAASRMGVPVDALELDDRKVYLVDNPNYFIPLSTLAIQRPGYGSKPFIAHGRFIQPDESWDKSRVRGYPMPPFPAYASGTQIFKIRVDPETGKITVLKVIVAQDVGKALNPIVVEGQIEGGFMQGLGYALYEGYAYDGGDIKNPNFYDYPIPTSVDIPEIELEIIEKADKNNPYGAKGVGEASLVPPGPAIANAVRDAVGVSPTELPMTPERIYWLIKSKEKKPA